jgi:hypothetical protein
VTIIRGMKHEDYQVKLEDSQVQHVER